MKNKGPMLPWTHEMNMVLFAVLAGSGVVLWWVLPPGSGGGHAGPGRGWRGGRGPAEALWDHTRHEWGDFHFWVAVALVVGIALHFALHWGSVKAACVRYLPHLHAQRTA